jgi:hypothetical protein
MMFRKLSAQVLTALVFIVSVTSVWARDEGTDSSTVGMETAPGVGATIIEDPLMAPGVLTASTPCPTGAGIGEFVGEGYILKVSGRCAPNASGPGILSPRLQTPAFTDGEIAVEFKVVNGVSRADLWLAFRESSAGGYQLSLVPAAGSLSLALIRGTTANVLAFQRALTSEIRPEDWNSLAIRARGSRFWVLINDQVIFEAEDAGNTFESGSIRFMLTRLGSVNDREETAVVFRNFRVSSLAE